MQDWILLLVLLFMDYTEITRQCTKLKPYKGAFILTPSEISSLPTLCYFSILGPFSPGWKALPFESYFPHIREKGDRFWVEWVILTNLWNIWPLTGTDPLPQLTHACQPRTTLKGMGPTPVVVQTSSNKQTHTTAPMVVTAVQGSLYPRHWLATGGQGGGRYQPRSLSVTHKIPSVFCKQQH